MQIWWIDALHAKSRPRIRQYYVCERRVFQLWRNLSIPRSSSLWPYTTPHRLVDVVKELLMNWNEYGNATIIFSDKKKNCSLAAVPKMKASKSDVDDEERIVALKKYCDAHMVDPRPEATCWPSDIWSTQWLAALPEFFFWSTFIDKMKFGPSS